MENHLKMLQTFAEEQVEQYVSDVVNKGTTDAKVQVRMKYVFTVI